MTVRGVRPSLFQRGVAALVGMTMGLSFGVGPVSAKAHLRAKHQAKSSDAVPAAHFASPNSRRVFSSNRVIPSILGIRKVQVFSSKDRALLQEKSERIFDGTSLGVDIPKQSSGQFQLLSTKADTVHAVTLRGMGRFSVEVFDELNGVWIASDIPMVELNRGGWTRIVFSNSIRTNQVRIAWGPQESARVEEVAIWTRKGTSVLKDGTFQGDVDSDNEVRAVGERYAMPMQRDGSFVGRLPERLENYAAATLRYRLKGRSHWTQVERSINGVDSLPASDLVASKFVTTQREPISLSVLKSGANRVEFTKLEPGSTDLEISEVELILHRESGSSFYNIPTLTETEVRLSPNAKAHELTFYVRREGAGELIVRPEGADRNLVQRVSMHEYKKGWHRLELDERIARAGSLLVSLQPERKEGKSTVGVRIDRFLVSYSSVRDPNTPRVDYVTYYGEGHVEDVEIRGISAKEKIESVVSSGRNAIEIAEDGSFLAAIGDSSLSENTVRVNFGKSRVHERRVEVDPCVLDGIPALSGLFPDVGASHSVCIERDKGGIVRYGELTLKVPPGALDRNTRISVRPLDAKSLAKLGGKRKNVTDGAPGFRLGPPGLKFRKPALLTLPYDPEGVPQTQNEGQIYAMYYDVQGREWSKIPRMRAPHAGAVESATHHFTDFVAATIPTPDSPGPRSLESGALKEEAVANPLAGIQLIESPEPNALGSAAIRHPIVIPPGRNGMAPSLSFDYSSNSGNGWLGVGWSIPVSTISVSTRHGVPRYDKEDTLRYTLDGADLKEVDGATSFFRSRPALESSRGDVTQFARKVEGSFHRILRVGNRAPYSWEVHSKDGAIRYYGETADGRLSDPDESRDPSSRKRVGRWYLQRAKDKYGNTISYYYGRDEGCLNSIRNANASPAENCKNRFTRIYLRSIEYTRYRGEGGNLPTWYNVRFDSYSGVRNDIVTSARLGFVEATRKKLAAVTVAKRNNSLARPDTDAESPPTAFSDLIRRYLLKYRTGDFSKSLLDEILVQGKKEATDKTFDEGSVSRSYFTKHDFTYESNIANSNVRGFDIFSKPVENGVRQTQPQSVGVLSVDGSGPWAHSSGKSTSKSRFAGIGFGIFGSVSGNWGSSESRNLADRALVDINGDGLADLVQKQGPSRLAQVDRDRLREGVDWTAAKQGSKSRVLTNPFQHDLAQADWPTYRPAGETKHTAVTLNSARSGSWSGGISGSVGGVFGLSGSAGFSLSRSIDRSGMFHMSPDGLIDHVAAVSGSSQLDYPVELRVWNGTTDGESDGKVNWGRIPSLNLKTNSMKALDEERRKASLPIEPVARWTAPRSGWISIRGAAKKLEVYTGKEPEDGLSAQIYQKGSNRSKVLWERSFVPLNYNPCEPGASNSCGSGIDTYVEAGDQLFFRVRLQQTGSPQVTDTAIGDALEWSPIIAYTSEGQNDLEPYGRPRSRFEFESDFRLTSSDFIRWGVPSRGRVEINGTATKQTTADDISIKMIIRDGRGSVKRTIDKVYLSSDSGDLGFYSGQVPVVAGDQIVVRVESDSPVDPSRIAFVPTLKFYDDEDTSSSTGNPEVSSDKFYPVYSMFNFLSHSRTREIEAGTVSLKLRLEGYSPDQLQKSVLLLQGVHRLIRKVRPNSLGIVELNENVVGPGPFFITLIRPEQSGSNVVELDGNRVWNDRVLSNGFHSPNAASVDLLRGGFHNWHFGDFLGSRDLSSSSSLVVAVDQVTQSSPFVFGAPASDVFLHSDKTRAIGWRFRGRASLTSKQWVPDRAGAAVTGADSSDDGPRRSYISGLRSARTLNFDFGLGVSIANAGYNYGISFGERAFLDVNADGMTDVIERGGVRYNLGRQNGFSDPEPMDIGFDAEHDLSVSRHHTGALGFSFGRALSVVSLVSASGVFEGFRFDGGFPRGSSYSTSGLEVELMDMNGDGVLDQVHRSGTADFTVRLGLGYGFAEPMKWPCGAWMQYESDRTVKAREFENISDLTSSLAKIGKNRIPNVLRVSDSTMLNRGGGVSKLIVVGKGKSTALNRVVVDLIDLNGDGLPDAVMKNPSESFLRVRVNTGVGFAAEEEWEVPDWPSGTLDFSGDLSFMGQRDVLGLNSIVSRSKSLGFSFCVGICVGASRKKTDSDDETILAFKDVNGDGLIDHILKGADGNSYVKINQLGKSNLLVRVKNSIGGEIELAYTKTGNYVGRRSIEGETQWVNSQQATNVLTASINRAELGVAGGTASYLRDFSYEGAYYDRREKLNYGFAKVSDLWEYAPNKYLENSTVYHNNTQVLQGLKKRESEAVDVKKLSSIRDVVSETSYFYKDVDGDSWVGTPVLERRERRDREPNSPLWAKIVDTYDYDAYGDVTVTKRLGDETKRDDDLVQTIGYFRRKSPYLGLLESVKIEEYKNSTELEVRRETNASYTDYGVLKSTSEYLAGGQDQSEATPDSERAVTQYQIGPRGTLDKITSPSDSTLEFVYEPYTWSYVQKVTNSFGESSSTFYDLRFGLPAQVVDPNTNTISYEYDDYGRPKAIWTPSSSRSPQGNFPTVKFRYSHGANQPSKRPWAASKQIDLQNNAGDDIVTVNFADGLGRPVGSKRDAEVGDYLGTDKGTIVADLTFYNLNGQRETVFVPYFLKNSDTNDLEGDEVELQADYGLRGLWRFNYDWKGREISRSQPNGGVSTTQFRYEKSGDRIEQVAISTDAENRKITKRWNLIGQPVSVTRHLEEQSGVRDLTTSYVHSALGEIEQVKDANGNIFRAGYDTMGNMTSLASPDSGLTRYFYDYSRNLVKEEPAFMRAKKQSITYQYENDRLIRVRYPGQQDVVIQYGRGWDVGALGFNRFGRKKSETSEIGVREFKYDAMGNVAEESVQFASELVNDAASKKMVVSSTYDDFGLLLNRKTHRAGICRESLDYSYDAGGRLTRLVGKIENAPENTNGSSLYCGGTQTYIDRVTYDAFGGRTSVLYGNKSQMRAKRNASTGRLEEQLLVWTQPGTNVGELQAKASYRYDKTGLVTQQLPSYSMQDINETRTGAPENIRNYRYDSLARLTSSDGSHRESGSPDASIRRYYWSQRYDDIDNVVEKTQRSFLKPADEPETRNRKQSYFYAYSYTGGRPHAVSRIKRNRIQRFGAVTEIEYDASGRQIYSEDWNNSREMAWTDASQIRSVHINGELKSMSYYDGTGARRIHESYPKGTKESVAYAGRELTLRNGSDLTYHIYADGQRIASRDGFNYQSGETTWYHADPLGSTKNSSDERGFISSTLEYFPSGEPWFQSYNKANLAAAIPKFTFSGKEYDESTGLYNFGARHYDPRMGVWMSPDPAMGEYFTSELAGGVYEPKNLGGYTYAWNNPVTFEDADGRVVQIPMATAGGAVAGFLVEGISQAISGKFDPTRLLVKTAEGALAGAMAGATGGMSLIVQAGVGATTAAVVGAAGREALGEEQSVEQVVEDAVIGAAGPAVGDALSSMKNAAGRVVSKVRGGPKVTPKGVCFLAGTEIDTAQGWVAIEDIRVGERVLTLGEVSSEATEVEPWNWRLLRVRMQNPDGSGDILEFELLRSLEWMAQIGAHPGQEIDFELEEMGLAGRARVETVEPCPEIEEGPGRVVLSTVTHYNGNVWRISFEDSEEVVEATGLHRLFSQDRQDWVKTQKLEVGESLRTKRDPAVIARVERLPGVHRVYNLEVETEHSYLASTLGVLSHNSNPCGKGAARSTSGPVFATDAEAAAVAKKLGFRKMRGVRSEDQAVFKKGRRFITRDATSHSGGAFKMADSVENLARKTTRMGTYDRNLNWIAD